MTLAAILAATTVGLSYRLVLTQQGRSTESVSLENDKRLLRPLTLEDLSDRGELSLLSGQDIRHVFHAQIPVVPYLSTQASLLKIDPEKSYIITSERALFERLRSSLGSVSVYRNSRLTFNGALYPRAFVLESPLPKDRFRNIPIRFSSIDEPGVKQYVLLPSREAFLQFMEGRDPSKKLNLILPNTRVLHDNRQAARFVRQVNSFSILGKNAVMARPDKNIYYHDLLLLPKNFNWLTRPEGDWFRGEFSAPGRTFYIYALPLIMASLGFLGLILRGYPLRWALWAFIGVAGFLFAPNWHLFLTGLIASGLVQFGLRIRGASIPWFILAGSFAYGFGFQPYLVDPFHGFYQFWIGFLLGLLTTLSGWSDRIRKNPTFGDVIALVLGVMSFGVAVLYQFDYATLGQGWMAITFLPPAVFLITAVNRPRHWPWMTGMAAWFVLFYRSGNTGVYLVFLLSMAGWIFFEATRRALTSGSRGRRPI